MWVTSKLTETHELTEVHFTVPYAPMISRGLFLAFSMIPVQVGLYGGFGEAIAPVTMLLGCVVVFGVLMAMGSKLAPQKLKITVGPVDTEVEGYLGWTKSHRRHRVPTRGLTLKRSLSRRGGGYTVRLSAPGARTLVYPYLYCSEEDLDRIEAVIAAFQENAEALAGEGSAEVPDGLLEVQQRKKVAE